MVAVLVGLTLGAFAVEAAAAAFGVRGRAPAEADALALVLAVEVEVAGVMALCLRPAGVAAFVLAAAVVAVRCLWAVDAVELLLLDVADGCDAGWAVVVVAFGPDVLALALAAADDGPDFFLAFIGGLGGFGPGSCSSLVASLHQSLDVVDAEAGVDCGAIAALGVDAVADAEALADVDVEEDVSAGARGVNWYVGLRADVLDSGGVGSIAGRGVS